MKRLATVIAVAGLIGAPAFAADMGVPPPAPAPVYNWTGWYVGVNAGASFGDAKTDFNRRVSVLEIQIPRSFVNREYPSGFIGGGQIGYNWQFSPIWVVGLEADFQGALEKDSNTITDSFSFNPNNFKCVVADPCVVGTAVTNYATKIEWFGTVRLRAGYVWGNGTVFSYVTGGLAYGKVDLDGTSTVSGTVDGDRTFSISHAIGHSQVNTGWVVGYGTEGTLLIPGWTWKIEGLWMDLGSLDATGVTSGVSASGHLCPCDVNGGLTTHTHFTDGILRGGLNYKFN